MSIAEHNNVENNQTERDWPFLLRVSPKTILFIVIGFLVIAWVSFIIFDIINLVPLYFDGRSQGLWEHLFNDQPVEWSQWFLLVYAIVSAGFLAGRLSEQENMQMVARFFLLFSIGLGLMLIEEAGDIRHTIFWYVNRLSRGSIFGIPSRVINDLIYFSLLASVPLYAVLRYGRYIWEYVNTRIYLLTGIILYGFIAFSSGIRHLGGFYSIIGAWIDRVIFLNRFPIPDGMTQDRGHFLLVDSVIEETIETLAIMFILAGILAFVNEIREAKAKEKA